MSWSRSAICFTAASSLAGAALLGCSCERPSLAVTGETTKLRLDEKPPKTTAWFDGERMRLRGVRGETLGVMLHLGEAARERELGLELPEGAARASAFEVGFLRVREPSSSMYGPSRGRGSYPDLLTPIEAPLSVVRRAYFDVAILPDAPAGLHHGVLRVGERSVPVELDVEELSIELGPQPLVWVFYHPKEVARAHGLDDDDGPELIELESRYHELFRAHGALLATNLGPSRFPPRRRFVKDVSYWPVSVDLTSEASIRRDVAAWLELFAGSSVVPFTIPIDEPGSLEHKGRAAEVARVIGEAGGGRPRLLRAVTDRVHPIYGDRIDVWFSPWDVPDRARARRERGERFWVYNGRPPSAGSMIVDTSGVALRTWGWIAYLYEIELWYAWEGLYFSDRYNGGGPTDVERQPISFDERRRGGTDHGNGDGVLAYPGVRPSLRLKALRRGLSDRQLLLHADRCGAREQAQRIARALVPRALGEASGRAAWPDQEDVWETARRELLDLLKARCR
jgi:hypothetical protein